MRHKVLISYIWESYLNLSKIICMNLHSFFRIASLEVRTSCPNLYMLGRLKKYGFMRLVISDSK